ncbi:MAG: hypothetical protein R3C05_23360 [Pirellulaceae bacterium]
MLANVPLLWALFIVRRLNGIDKMSYFAHSTHSIHFDSGANSAFVQGALGGDAPSE